MCSITTRWQWRHVPDAQLVSFPEVQKGGGLRNGTQVLESPSRVELTVLSLSDTRPWVRGWIYIYTCIASPIVIAAEFKLSLNLPGS